MVNLRPSAVLVATLLYAAALALWFGLVKPANDILATWTPGPIPENFEAVRLRWETGHMAVTAAKALGFISLVSACSVPGMVDGPPLNEPGFVAPIG